MIELKDVNKRFGRRPAVEGLSLEVEPGGVYGLLGHNGAGKSTTIGMMLGQVWPDSGSVRVDGCDVTSDRSRALARVGAIFETPVFYDYLSGWANLEILSQYTAPTPASRLREVVDWVGLSGREKSLVRTYSHGMRTRLALAQALLPSPRLLILDEPGDGLDPEGIHEMRITIQRLARELSLTILLSSHQLNEVEQLCTRIAVLKSGRKVFEGSIAEARRTQTLVRIVADDFSAVERVLTEQRLLSRTVDSGLVELADGAGTDVALRVLVEAGVRVFELGRVEQTLESFYLELMHAGESKEGAL